VATVHPYPRLRWFALVWLMIYLPAYAHAYGAWHFLFLCNLGVLITAAGLIAGNQLLLSSQAVAAPMISLLWIADLLCHLGTGRYLHGGTAYLWDAAVPWPARVLSGYHALWPVLLFHCLRRGGYDRRGFALQAAVVVMSFALALAVAPRHENIDYVFHWHGDDPAQSRPTWQVPVMAMALIAIYWPTHLLLRQAFRRPRIPCAAVP
jgi:hypothetical protein